MPSQTGVVDVRLLNVGLGPALRVVTTSRYEDGGYEPEIKPVTEPAIMPGDDLRLEVPVYFPRKPDQINLGGFKIQGTYMDPSLRRQYEVIAEWDAVSS